MKYIAIACQQAQKAPDFIRFAYHLDRVLTASGDVELGARAAEAIADAYNAGLDAGRAKKGRR